MRQLAIALLDDEYGINAEAWRMLSAALEDEGGNDDILCAVRSADGRFYLPDDWK